MSVIDPPQTAVCKYQRALDALRADPLFDEDDAVQVTEWLAGHTPAAHIARALRDAGYRLGVTVIKDHRRGECPCSVAS